MGVETKTPQMICPQCGSRVFGQVYMYLHELGFHVWDDLRTIMSEKQFGDAIGYIIADEELCDVMGLPADSTKEEVRAWVLRKRLEKKKS